MSANPVKIAPSLLAANMARLGEEVAALEKAGADWFHFDIMDGHFVPNISFGAGHVAAVRDLTQKCFDVHLMVEAPERQIPAFIEAGADALTIHPEAGPHPHRLLQMIKKAGLKAGIALNPGTPASVAEPLLELADLVLVMSVNPGWGGQAFMPAQMEKIRVLAGMIKKTGRTIEISVDGGIAPETAPLARAAGADILVAGTAILGQENYQAAIEALRGGEA